MGIGKPATKGASPPEDASGAAPDANARNDFHEKLSQPIDASCMKLTS
jgi:hypothetical protein